MEAIKNKNENPDIIKEELEALIKRLESKNPNKAMSILEAKFENPREALLILEMAFKHKNQRVREEVLFILTQALVDYIYKPEDIQEFYRVASESPYEDVRIKAKEIFGELLPNGIQ